MKLTVVAVGRRMPAWVETGVLEYTRRLPSHLRPAWVEIAPGQRSGESRAGEKSAVAVEREGARILRSLPAHGRVIALDVHGEPWSTVQLSERLERWQMAGEPLSLLIGGPDGLSGECLRRADESWSLSALTLPHPLVRVVLAEQLYRAWTITVNHPYHRE